jgi:hypothetical protein
VRAALDEYTLTILGDGRGELTSVVRGPPPVREDWLVDDYFGDPDPIKPGYDLTESTTEVDFADFEGMAPLNPDNSYEPFDGNGERDLPGETRAYPPGWLNGLDGEVEVIPSPSGDGIDAVIPSPKSVRRPNRRGCHPLLWFDTVLSHERLYISKWNEEKPTRTEWIKSAFRHPWKTSYTSFMVYVMGKEIKD